MLRSNARRLLRVLSPILPDRFRRSARPEEVERAELIFYIKYIRQGMTVFDVGANVGRLTVLFSDLVGPEGRVFAFEAASPAYNRLSSVCTATGLTNVSLNHLALTDQEGRAFLNVYDDDHLGWCTMADRPLNDYGIDVQPVGREAVTATTIDAYSSLKSIDVVHLLKIDVEGAEYQVLLGAQRMLREHRIKCCLFEFGATTFDNGNNPEEIVSYLASVGYKIRNVVWGDQIFPGRKDAKNARFSMHVAVPKR